eukprot:9217326-Pyramimonas_sp.AAC.1
MVSASWRSLQQISRQVGSWCYTAAACARAASCGSACICITVLDWQRRTEILRGSEWVDSLDAVILAPTLPTCSNAGGGKCLDYFVVRHSLQHGHEIRTLPSVATEPHKPVLLRLKASRDVAMVSRVLAPRRFPQ